MSHHEFPDCGVLILARDAVLQLSLAGPHRRREFQLVRRRAQQPIKLGERVGGLEIVLVNLPHHWQRSDQLRPNPGFQSNFRNQTVGALGQRREQHQRRARIRGFEVKQDLPDLTRDRGARVGTQVAMAGDSDNQRKPRVDFRRGRRRQSGAAALRGDRGL